MITWKKFVKLLEKTSNLTVVVISGAASMVANSLIKPAARLIFLGNDNAVYPEASIWGSHDHNYDRFEKSARLLPEPGTSRKLFGLDYSLQSLINYGGRVIITSATTIGVVFLVRWRRGNEVEKLREHVLANGLKNFRQNVNVRRLPTVVSELITMDSQNPDLQAFVDYIEAGWPNEILMAAIVRCQPLEDKSPGIVSVGDSDGNTLMHHAAKKGNDVLLEKLCQLAPKVAFQENNKGERPIVLAKRLNRTAAKLRLSDCESHLREGVSEGRIKMQAGNILVMFKLQQISSISEPTSPTEWKENKDRKDSKDGPVQGDVSRGASTSASASASSSASVSSSDMTSERTGAAVVSVSTVQQLTHRPNSSSESYTSRVKRV